MDWVRKTEGLKAGEGCGRAAWGGGVEGVRYKLTRCLIIIYHSFSFNFSHTGQLSDTSVFFIVTL